MVASGDAYFLQPLARKYEKYAARHAAASKRIEAVFAVGGVCPCFGQRVIKRS